jgi:hypothetical protein
LTEEGWKQFAQVLIARWPSKQWGRESIAAYIAEVQASGVTDPAEALGILRNHPGAFPPSVGEVATAYERRRQGPAPSWHQAHAVLARHITKLDYFRPASTFDKFVAACAADHEAVGRLALVYGPQGIRELPDPTVAQDTGGSIRLTQAERAYTEVRRAWELDPRPGLALEEAEHLTLREIGVKGGMRGVVDGLAPAGELEAGEQ